MHLNMTIHRPLELNAFSIPEGTTEQGRHSEATIALYLASNSGENPATGFAYLSIEEAEAIANRLTELVSDAKRGVFSEAGVEMNERRDARREKLNAE
jgi:hypothetical protein